MLEVRFIPDPCKHKAATEQARKNVDMICDMFICYPQSCQSEVVHFVQLFKLHVCHLESDYRLFYGNEQCFPLKVDGQCRPTYGGG